MRNSRRIALSELEPARVCIVKPSALGDVVQTLPVLSALRLRWPRAHISWVIKRPLAALLEGHPQIDALMPFARSGSVAQRAESGFGLLRALRRGNFDLAIDLQGLLRSGLMTRATGAMRRIGFRDAREGAAWCYTDWIDAPMRQLPAVARYWCVAQALGCEGAPPPVQLGIQRAHREWAQTQLDALPRPILAIHPGAAWQTKRWPPAHFSTVAKRFQEQFGGGVVLLGGPDEGAIATAIQDQLPTDCVNLAARTNLLELAALVAGADMVLAGDTGPMHLAAAMETRVVALFTCTDPARAGPWGRGHEVVQTTVSCAASYRTKCPTMHCMSELEPARVWPAVCRTVEAAIGDPSRAA